MADSLVSGSPELTGAEEARGESPKMLAPVTLHLTFIDGMRGCAASYIVFSHAWEMSGYQPVGAVQRALAEVLGHGHSVVTIFIGISGFCLMLPVARNGTKIVGGARRFFKGRVHRILPPYYIALALSILVVTALMPTGERAAFLRAPATEFSILMHLLLMQNLTRATYYGINGPLWSVATECQIYLLFPLMVMAWRRFGRVASLLGIFVLAHLAFHAVGDQIAFNYIFTFALGMAGAMASMERRSERWLLLACCCTLIGFVLSVRWKFVVSDLCVGVFVSTLMTLLSGGRIAWLRKLLSLRLLTWVGSFSYSLYLIHALLQDWYLSTAFSARHTGQLLQLLVMVFAVSPVNFLVAYLFYFVAERPFLNRHRRQVEVPVIGVVGQQGSAVVNV